eukprot:1747350-Pyramimonas_sp.AAC.2
MAPLAAAPAKAWRYAAPWRDHWREWRDMGPGDCEGWKEVGKAPARAKCGCKKNVRGNMFCRACGHKLSDVAPGVEPKPAGVWAGDQTTTGDGAAAGKKGKGKKGKGKGDSPSGGKGGPVLPLAPGAQLLASQPAAASLEISELEQLVAMLEKAGDVAGAAKHKRTLADKKKQVADAQYVAPLSQRVTQAHDKVREFSQKLEKAVGHFEKLSEGLEQ